MTRAKARACKRCKTKPSRGPKQSYCKPCHAWYMKDRRRKIYLQIPRAIWWENRDLHILCYGNLHKVYHNANVLSYDPPAFRDRVAMSVDFRAEVVRGS